MNSRPANIESPWPADFQGMTQTTGPEIFQNTIVIPDSHKDVLAAAMRDALQTAEMTERRTLAAVIETPAQQRANARAQRLAWFVESL